MQIERAAARHHGVLTTEQPRALGLTDAAISRWAKTGRLFSRYRGVYAVGRRQLTPLGEWTAALAALGPESWLSHRSAVERRGWHAGFSLPIHLTTTRGGLRSRRGLVIHYASTQPSVTTRHGVRVTTAARTLADMAASLDDGALIRLCGNAAYAGHYDRLRLLDELGGRRPGAVRLRRVLSILDVGGGHTRSELEDALRALIARHRIRPPDFNEPLAGFVADALWPDARLVVELDSRSAHDNEPAFFTDREKDLVYAEHALNACG